MLSLPYYRQTTDYNCGPSCLRMIFGFFGKEKNEEALEKELGAGKDVWVSNDRLEEVARKEGFHTLSKKEASLDDVRHLVQKGIPVIVNYFEPKEKEGHFAVVIGTEKDDIVMNDPWHGEHFHVSQKYFLEHWRSYDGNFPRWFLAISHTPIGKFW